MWIFDFLPDFIFHFILLAGIIGFFVSIVIKNIPIVDQYKTLIQLVSVIAISTGIYFEGGISNEMKWKSRVQELEIKIEKAKVESSNENSKRIEELSKKEKILDKRQYDIDRKVNEQLKKYDTECAIPNEFIQIINEAAEKTK